MSKFSNAERVANYAIVNQIEVSAAELQARAVLKITLTSQEREQAQALVNVQKRANWQVLEQERRARMNDNRWQD